MLTENPARHARPVRVKRPERTILTPREVAGLFTTSELWGDFRHYAINVLAATTGMRMGELRALLVENVKSDHVEIRRSWEQGYGPRAPKADSMRDIPMSPIVSAILARLIEEIRPTTLLFYGRAGKDTPMSKTVIALRVEVKLAFATAQLTWPVGPSSPSGIQLVWQVFGPQGSEALDGLTLF